MLGQAWMGAGGCRRGAGAEHHLWGCALQKPGFSFITSFSSRALPSWVAWKPLDPRSWHVGAPSREQVGVKTRVQTAHGGLRAGRLVQPEQRALSPPTPCSVARVALRTHVRLCEYRPHAVRQAWV